MIPIHLGIPASTGQWLDRYKTTVVISNPAREMDCYFYYYSSCTKGSVCPFRHEPLALGEERVCNFWRMGRCSKAHCAFRHMDISKPRNQIPCYWETQPDGCAKDHCPFKHEKPGKSLPNSSDAGKSSSVPVDGTVKCATRETQVRNRLGPAGPTSGGVVKRSTIDRSHRISARALSSLKSQAATAVPRLSPNDLRNRIRRTNTNNLRSSRHVVRKTVDEDHEDDDVAGDLTEDEEDDEAQGLRIYVNKQEIRRNYNEITPRTSLVVSNDKVGSRTSKEGDNGREEDDGDNRMADDSNKSTDVLRGVAKKPSKRKRDRKLGRKLLKLASKDERLIARQLLDMQTHILSSGQAAGSKAELAAAAAAAADTTDDNETDMTFLLKLLSNVGGKRKKRKDHGRRRNRSTNSSAASHAADLEDNVIETSDQEISQAQDVEQMEADSSSDRQQAEAAMLEENNKTSNLVQEIHDFLATE